MEQCLDWQACFCFYHFHKQLFTLCCRRPTMRLSCLISEVYLDWNPKHHADILNWRCNRWDLKENSSFGRLTSKTQTVIIIEIWRDIITFYDHHTTTKNTAPHSWHIESNVTFGLHLKTLYCALVQYLVWRLLKTNIPWLLCILFGFDIHCYETTDHIMDATVTCLCFGQFDSLAVTVYT